MNITVAENAGFCPGVKKADNAIMALTKNYSGKIYTLGKLIHNRIYNENLERLGIVSVTLDEISRILSAWGKEKITLVIRTHGITKEENDYLIKLKETNENFNIVDMTCAYVKRIHKIAEENTSDDTVFLLYCDKNHPEAKGIISYAKGEKYMFSDISELKTLDFGKKVPILCSQTTQNLLEFKKIKNFFKKLYTNLIFFDTICSVTQKRQDEAVSLADKSDAMIVIGGKDSSNTHKLFDLCKARKEKTVWIETANDLKKTEILRDAQNIGITAGASTPDDIILEVIKQWKKN